MSVFPVFKITKMLRSPENDMTDFIFLGEQYRLIARPLKYWKYFPWSRRFHGKKVFYQCPWLTFFSFPSVDPSVLLSDKSNSLKSIESKTMTHEEELTKDWSLKRKIEALSIVATNLDIFMKSNPKELMALAQSNQDALDLFVSIMMDKTDENNKKNS